MSSKAIRGVTIEIDGSTKKLDASLKGVEKQSKNIQTELKAVERALKLDPKNVNLLAQKTKLMGDAVKVSKEKVDALKQAQVQANQAFKDGKIGEDQYRKIQREVVFAESELKKLTKAQDDMNNKWKSAGESVSAFGGNIEAAGKKVAPLSAAAAGALAGIVALVAKSGAGADDLNTLSKQTGIATDELQKFQYAADIIDVPMETFTGSLAKLTRSMNAAKKGTKIAEDAFSTLGVQWDDGTGKLRDNEAVFYDIIDALGKVESETDRDALAMELFGRSAQDLNPLVLGGADALKKLGKEAEDLGLILSQTELDELNAFNDELDKSKAQLKAAGMVAANEFGKVLLPILQSLAKGIQAFTQWLGKLNPNIAKIILGILAFVAALAPLLIFVGKVIWGVGQLIGFLSKLGPVIAAVKAGFALLLGPVGLVIAAIAAAIAIGVLLYKNWDKIKEWAGNLKEAIAKAWAGIKTSISKAWESLKEIDLVQLGKDMITGLIKGIIGMGGAVVDAVKGLGAGAVKGMKNFLGIKSPSKVFESLGNYTAEGFAKGLEGTQKSLADAARGMGKTAINSVSEVVHSGTITVNGVNNRGELVASMDVMGELRRGRRR